MKKTILLSTLLLATALFTGCSSNSDDSNKEPINESYSSNKAGVIEASTLTKYIDNWKENKPAGTNGRLVIFQAGSTSNNKFIKANESEDVVVYQIPDAGSCDPTYVRHDGFSNVPGSLLSGPYVDGMINMFNLDPQNDFVVFSVGKGTTGMREIVRSWWVLVYWGWNEERLAFLNGSVSYDFSASSGISDYLVDTTSTPPATPSTYSMKSLATNRTDLHIYIKDVMNIASKDDKTGYFIADARGTDEYTGAKKSRTLDVNCGVNGDEQCYSPVQGHIRDAVNFPYTDILVLDDATEDITGDGVVDSNDASFKFKTKSELQTLYAAKGYKSGDKIIAYCRAGRKATLLALTAHSVLGYNVAMYDGSWIQWGQMANSEDVDGLDVLPQDSVWRTDVAKYTDVEYYVDPIQTQSGAPYSINFNATSSSVIQNEDRAYLGL